MEGLNSKVKLGLYKHLVRKYTKRYPHGVSDAGTGLLFKFRSGTHGLNEELGRHRGRNGRTECVLCGDECESVVHVLWECPAYKDGREEFMIKLRSTVREVFIDFEALDNIERASFVLGCELWMENFDAMLALVKEYIIDLWKVRKVKLYGEPCSTQPVLGIRGMTLWLVGREEVSLVSSVTEGE